MESIEWRLLFQPIYRRGAKAVLRRSGIREGALLEVGCSSGYQLQAFKEAGSFSVEGIDIDAKAISHARQILGLNAREGDLEAANYASSSLDLVIMFNVLEHLISPRQTLREISRILRPGGVLALKAPNGDSLQRHIFGRRWQIICEAPRHVQIPSKKGIAILLSETGLIHEGSFPAPTIENSVSIALSIVPNATAHLLEMGAGRLGKLLLRAIGQGAGVLSVPLAFAEGLTGSSGTLVHLARKPSSPIHG